MSSQSWFSLITKPYFSRGADSGVGFAAVTVSCRLMALVFTSLVDWRVMDIVDFSFLKALGLFTSVLIRAKVIDGEF